MTNEENIKILLNARDMLIKAIEAYDLAIEALQKEEQQNEQMR